MRKVLLVCVGIYLACGVTFGFVTEQESYMCTGTKDDHGMAYYGAVNDIPDIPWYCLPAIGAVDRLRWAAITTPGWLPIVIHHLAG